MDRAEPEPNGLFPLIAPHTITSRGDNGATRRPDLRARPRSNEPLRRSGRPGRAPGIRTAPTAAGPGPGLGPPAPGAPATALPAGGARKTPPRGAAGAPPPPPPQPGPGRI